MAEVSDDKKLVWRFGYGSNIGLTTLKEKKNLTVSRYLVGTIKGYSLYFFPGLAYVDPGFAAVMDVSKDNPDKELHGSAFLIPFDEAQGLDRQESSYDVVPSRFVSYDGIVIENVGLYVPSQLHTNRAATPSLRYLRLLQNGAREAGLAKEWIDQLDNVPHYVPSPDVRKQTLQWIQEFHDDPTRKDVTWTAETLSKYDGSSSSFPTHTSVMGYIVKLLPSVWVFASYKGHTITRRNLLHFNGKSVDVHDIRYGQPGFRPLPNLNDCTEEEKEFVLQNLEALLHKGGTIVARLQDFLEDQQE